MPLNKKTWKFSAYATVRST